MLFSRLRPQFRSFPVSRIRDQERHLASLSDPQLQRAAEDLRESFHHANGRCEHRVASAVAFARQAIERVMGYKLYEVQEAAALALIQGSVAEMQTGEGKTLSAVPAAIFSGMIGKGTHVATPNTYLAQRDFSQLQPVYELLGLSVSLVGAEDDRSVSDQEKRQAYNCDITYGPGFEFGFDYLRDQVALKKLNSQPLGLSTLQVLRGQEPDCSVQCGRLGSVIVDEIDNVLIDDSSSPQILSEFQPGEACDQNAVRLARELAVRLWEKEHYVETLHGKIELTPAGVQLIHDPSMPIPVDELMRPWGRYVEAALTAELKFQRDVHYVVLDGQVRIVEQSTGRIFEDRSWQSGLHQAVEAKEHLPIKPESRALAQITRQRFFSLYDRLSGMTGTASDCRAEFRSVYQLDVVSIPLRQPTQRITLPIQAFRNGNEKWDAIAQSVAELNLIGRPVLVGTRTIVESQKIASLLESLAIPFQLLNGKQDADEADIIRNSGRLGSVTIATNLAGRGTDIKLDAESRNRGGLHVIVSECHASARVDRQLIGRCARQGDPGTCQIFVAADDWLLQQHAPWFAESLEWATHRNVSVPRLQKRIRKIQASIERQQFASRLLLLQQHEEQNRVFAQA